MLRERQSHRARQMPREQEQESQRNFQSQRVREQGRQSLQNQMGQVQEHQTRHNQRERQGRQRELEPELEIQRLALCLLVRIHLAVIQKECSTAQTCRPWL
jgi:hypothetical protein